MSAWTRLFGHLRRAQARPLATKFIHVYHLPLIPLGTVEILDEPTGITNPTRFSLRSLFISYAQSWGVLVAVALSGWAFAYVAGCLWRAANTPEAAALVERPNLRRDAAERAIVEQSINRSRYQDRLYPIARAHYEKASWNRSRCDDAAISSAPEEKAGELLLIEYHFIGKVLDPDDARPTMREWLVSEPLSDLARLEIPAGTFAELDMHRYVGVISLREERKTTMRRSIIAGHLVVYDWNTHTVICETPVKVTGRGRPIDLRNKFIARLEKKLREISRTLHVERPRMARRRFG